MIEPIRHYLALNGFVPSVVLVMIYWAVLARARTALWGLAVIALPGTLAHELAHLAVGFVLMAKPGGFSLWPRRCASGWTLGETSFRRAGIFNSAFIALAPLSLLPLGWLCLTRLSVPAWAAGHWTSWLAAGYLAATLFYACMPSRTDIKLGGLSLTVYLILIGLCWTALPALRSWVS